MRIPSGVGGRGEDIPGREKLNEDYIIFLFLIFEVKQISVMLD
jgi:hypothetical protein